MQIFRVWVGKKLNFYYTKLFIAPTKKLQVLKEKSLFQEILHYELEKQWIVLHII